MSVVGCSSCRSVSVGFALGELANSSSSFRERVRLGSSDEQLASKVK